MEKRERIGMLFASKKPKPRPKKIMHTMAVVSVATLPNPINAGTHRAIPRALM